MDVKTPNGLAAARSAYLRTALHQPVEWNEWCPEAFLKAQQEDRPILLDIGAVWCHWCHVMDHESYEDPETAELINKLFVPIKVDRDERPDIDTRYQAAVAAISGQGGWPLTAFLTPEGKPYFAGTYFPPTDQHGRPSFRRVLFTMAEAFQKQREDVEESAVSVMAAIEQSETFAGRADNPGQELVEKIVASALQQFDSRYGGFGSQPKFPNSAALDLLIDEAGRGGPHAEPARDAVLLTLDRMAAGGIYDHLAGGFHRYSVDERWVVPHFEKMSYDNSELLKNFVHAFQTFGEARHARTAREIMRWIDDHMSDRELGGFYASQDADHAPGDDGDFFTWTLDEAAAVLTPAELVVAGPWFDIGPLGEMHHNFAKNVLHIDRPLSEVARLAGVTEAEAEQTLAQAKARLYAARQLRPAPSTDRTIYVGWNAMMVSAYVAAGRLLEDSGALQFGLKTLDRLLASMHGNDVPHVIAYADPHPDRTEPPVPGGLEDFVWTAHAALDAWEATGEMRYFDAAQRLGHVVVEEFYDQDRGGFFDTPSPDEQEVRIGALALRRKPLQDAPSPSGNSVAAHLLVRLAELTGNESLRSRARATFECFAQLVEHFGLHCASYALALRRLTLSPTQIVVVGQDALADQLARESLKAFQVNKCVLRLTAIGELPPALTDTFAHPPYREGSFALVCQEFACSAPVQTLEDLHLVLP